MDKVRSNKKYKSKMHDSTKGLWTDPEFRRKALNRLGMVQQWIMMELFSGRHIGKDGIARITREDLYRDYYHIENDGKGGYKYYGKHFNPALQKKLDSAHARGSKSFGVLVEKGLIKAKFDFDGAYFILTQAGRDRTSSRRTHNAEDNIDASTEGGENDET
jgi:hypothetical protein